MRLSILSLTGLTVFGVVACGDDKQMVMIDAPIVVPIDAPNAPVFKGFKADEGGEVRLEYVNFVNGNAAVRVTNFLYKTAGSVPFHPLLNLNGCSNVDKGQGLWPSAQNPVAERVYMNPGLVLYSGGPTTFTARPNAADGFDAFGRNHPAGHFTFSFGGATANDAATYITDKTAYDVTFTGSNEIPAQIFNDVLWMPSNYALTTPPLASYPLTGGVAHTFNWTPGVQTGIPADRDVLSVVGFLNAGATTMAGGVSAICVEPDDGSVTVPAAMVDIVRAKYPTGGLFVRQTLTHVVRELVDNNGPTGRRIDFIAVWCNVAPFTVP